MADLTRLEVSGPDKGRATVLAARFLNDVCHYSALRNSDDTSPLTVKPFTTADLFYILTTRFIRKSTESLPISILTRRSVFQADEGSSEWILSFTINAMSYIHPYRYQNRQESGISENKEKI